MINKAILLGHAGKVPERRGDNTDGPVTLGLATSYKYTNKQGERVDSPTQWHNLVFWGKSGDIAIKYIKKGDKLYIEGRIDYRKYTSKEGVEKMATSIIVERMQMLGSKGDNKHGNQDEPSPTKSYDDGQEINVEDIPF